MTSTVQDNYTKSHGDRWREPLGTGLSYGSQPVDDGDGNENVKKAIGLLGKSTNLHVHLAFLYISQPPLQEYDVKMPNFTFYGGRKQATTNVSFSL